MFVTELTSYGQSIVVSQVTIDGIILLYDYISSISSLSDISSYSSVLDIEACGNITKNIGCVKVCDHSSSQYQARTILFYVKDGSTKQIVAGYSQEDPIVLKNNVPLSVFLAFDFSAFTNGFLFSSVQSGYNNAMQNLDGIVHIDDPNVSSDDSYSVYSKTQVDTLLDDKQSALSAGNGIAISDNTIKTTGIPFGICDSTSTSTNFTVTVPGIYKLEDGVCCMVKNGVVTSAAGFTLNVNNLGGKPCYTNMAAATADTTVFNINYTMLFVYDSTRVTGGCWICYRGYYQSDTDKIGYQLRTNSTLMTVSDRARYYKIYFTSADNTQWVPAASNWVNDATTAKTVNQRPINPFGRIVYTSATTNYTAGSNLAAATIWDQYVVTLGYSFNTTGSALTLSEKVPVYVKCSPQSNGSAIIDSTTPIVQSLPSSNDGKIYILLGIATSATAVELIINHPVYYHDDSGIKLWTGTIVPTKVSQLTNDSGYITSYTETDPTVPSWAKESTKPSYTLDEVSDGTTRKLSNYVPTSRTVNNKALSSDITLTLDDVSDGTTRTLPTVNDATLTIQKNSTTIDTFSANASSNVTVNISVPTDTSDLTNGAGFITSADMSNFVTTNTTQTITGAKTFDSTVTLTDGTSITLNYSDEAIPDGEQSAPNDNYARLYTNTRHEIETSGDGSTVPNVVLDLGPYYYTNDSVSESDGSPEFLIMRDDTRVAQFGSYVYLNQLGRHYDAIPQAYITQIGNSFYPSTKIYSDQFIKHNGNSSQFLKADGSVDNNSYLTSSSLSHFVTLDTEQTITESKTFNSISLLPSGADPDSAIVLDTYHYDDGGIDTTSNEVCLRPESDEYGNLGDYTHQYYNVWAYNLHGNLDGSASSLSTNRHIDGVNFNGTSDIIHFGVCTVAANTQIKDVTIPNFNLNLVTGSRVIVKFSFVNSAANPQLRVNTSGTNGTAKPIVYRGTSAVGSTSYYSWQVGGSVEFVFDGTNWVWVGFQEYVYSASKASSATYLSTANNSSVAAAYYSNPTRAIIPYNSSTTSDIGTSSYRWRTLYLSTSISDGTNTFSLPSSSGTLALTSDIPEEIFCVSSGQSSIEIDSSNDYRDPIPASDPLSTNPRWAGNSVSLLVNQYVNLTANLRLSVYVPNQEFVGSIAFPIDSQVSGYAAYPIYFRGDTSTHNPVVPQGTILRLTFRQNAFHADFYDLADFGVEHEPIVRIGKVPHHLSTDSYNGALVGIRRDNNKFDALLTVVKSGGVATSTTMLDTIDCSPVYVSFQGECFSAHPRVPFGVFLCMEYIYSAGLTPSASNVAFDFVTSDSSTIADHIVTNTTVSNPTSRRRYFHVDNAPVFLLTITNTGHYISIGGIPNGCKGRLIGFLTEGTKDVGLLRLVQDNKIYSGTSTPIEFGDANSAASTTYTASLQLYNSDTTNYKNGISCTGNLLPSSTNTYSLGSTALKWGTTYTEIISMGLDNECTISHGSSSYTRYEHISITVTPENKNGSLHIDTSSYSERTGDWSTFSFSFSGNSFYSVDDGDLGTSLSPWGCTYTDKLYFGVVPSSETDTIACTLTKYSNDTTNYKNGLQCSCNFLPYYNNLYCLGSTALKWDTVYANQIGDSNNTVTVYGTASSATESEQLKKTVSSTDYTISLNSNNYWVSNTNILPSVNSTSTSTGKDLGSSSYKWRYLYTYQLGTSSSKVTNAYITNLYFGTANSASSSTYTAALKLYNSDTTNYRNGVSCTGNFLPNATNTYGLGSSTYKWKEAYFSGGNSSYYITIDNTGSQPTIRPSNNNSGYLGSSSYYWNYAYINSMYVKSINLAFVEIDIWGNGTSEAIIKVPYGTTISGTGNISGTDAYVTGIRYANLHFYGTSPNRMAYDEKGTNTDTITGSIKILSHILTWKNGSSVVRSYIVPALIIS